VVVLIGGQQIPDYTKYSWRALTEFRELLPIQQVEDWLEYSKSRWQCPHVTSAHVEALTLATGGDPGALSALLENMVREFQGNSDI
jgi:hypothetical protein